MDPQQTNDEGTLIVSGGEPRDNREGESLKVALEIVSEVGPKCFECGRRGLKKSDRLVAGVQTKNKHISSVMENRAMTANL